MDVSIIALEQFGVQVFALAVVIGKIITYTTLLLLAVIVEVGLVKRVYEAEFGGTERRGADGRCTDIIDPMRSRYIKASELRSFTICERAWSFERNGRPSALEKQRAAGERDHKEHARTASRIAVAMLVFGFAGLAVSLALWVIHR